jgi:hypothetical protein
MKPLHLSRSLPLRAALLLGAVVLGWGCSNSVTAPDPAASSAVSVSFAPLVTSEQLDASEDASGDSIAVAVRDQATVEPALKRHSREVVGTAASTFKGHPVVLALTRRPMRALPERVAGRRVMELVVGEVTAQAFYCGTSTGRANMCNAGTLGAIVTDGTRNYWLSNWHVFVRNAGVVGDAINAPGRVDVGCGTSNLVGNVSRFTPVRFDGSYNTMDCAIARIVPGTSVSAIQSAGANSFVASATTKPATIGLAVKKVGRTTKLTTGKVTAVNASLPVAYGGIGSANFRGVIIFSRMSEEGDSGSLICTQSGNNPVALLFAGSPTTSVGCPIGTVFSAMGAHIAN